MEASIYDKRLEEGLSLNRVVGRSRVRLMVLFKEQDLHGDLEAFANGLGYTVERARGYLDAYDKYVEYDLLPETFIDADDIDITDVMYELWESLYDSIARDSRYDRVDKDGISDIAIEMGLRGSGKAMDIAKNPKSMTAAIVGDSRASSAALEALLMKARRDPAFRKEMQTAGLFHVAQDEDEDVDRDRDRPRIDPWITTINHMQTFILNTRDKAFNDDDTPLGLYDACVQVIDVAQDIQALLRGRYTLMEGDNGVQAQDRA